MGATSSAPVQTAPGAHPASYTMGTGSFPGVKRPGRGVDHPPSSSSEVKERVKLYISPPFWVFMARYSVNFALFERTILVISCGTNDDSQFEYLVDIILSGNTVLYIYIYIYIYIFLSLFRHLLCSSPCCDIDRGLLE